MEKPLKYPEQLAERLLTFTSNSYAIRTFIDSFRTYYDLRKSLKLSDDDLKTDFQIHIDNRFHFDDWFTV